MLDLLRTYTGPPRKGLHHLVLPNQILLVRRKVSPHSRADIRKLLVIHLRRFHRHPGCSHSGTKTCSRVLGGISRSEAWWRCDRFIGDRFWDENSKDQTHELKARVDFCLKVVAAMGSRIACWSLSGGRTAVWRIHSTLVLSKDATITALDCKSGNSILSTIIVVPLCGHLNIRIARHWNQRRPISSHPQPRGRHPRVDSKMEEPVCRFPTLLENLLTFVSV